MGLTIEDLKPKTFEIIVQGVKLNCKPLRLSHALVISKIGEVFKDTKSASKQEIKQAEVDMDEVIAELIPELKGIELDISNLMDLITQLMEHIQPSDNKELSDKGVQFNDDPKVEKNG